MVKFIDLSNVDEITFKDALETRLLCKRYVAPSPDGRFVDCWWWKGSKGRQKYGYIGIGKNYKASRIAAYVWLDFDLNSGLHILHKCDNKACINPDHLFSGTHLENMQDKESKLRGNHKITINKLLENNILEIRKLFKENWTRMQLADLFDVSYQTISDIVLVKTWKHLT